MVENGFGRHLFFKNDSGFTLIELLVVAAIISIMSTLMLANYRAGERQFALQGSAHKLTQDLRRTEEITMSMQRFNCPVGELKGYGIRFEADNESYSLRARCGDGVSQDFEKESIPLDRGIKIKELRIDGVPTSPLDVFFYPPDPEIDFGGVNSAVIILCLKTDISNTKTVRVNKTGLVEIY